MKNRKIKRILSAVLVAVVTTIAAAGCGNNEGTEKESTKTESKEEKESTGDGAKKVLNWNVDTEPTALDPMLMGTTSMQVVNNTFEGLMRTYDGEVTNGIAKSYDVSEDELTYTFHIREDAKWSDGKDITAGDFIFAWTRMIDPELKNYYGSQFFYIENAERYYKGECSVEEVGFKAVDDKTIEVKLISPTPFFLSLTAFNIYYPVREDVVDDEGVWSRDPATYVCDGPFTLGEYKANESITLVKNENYWNADKVKLDEIKITFISDPSSAMTAYRGGEIDVFKGVPSQEIATLQAEDPEFYILPFPGVEYYVFNLERAPFDDVRVRQALNLAIDRTALVNNVTKSGEIATEGVVPHEMYLSDGRDFRDAEEDYIYDTTKADVEKAQALLAEAGYPNGENFPAVTLTYNNATNKKSVAEAVQQMWKENLGIEIQLNGVENEAVTSLRNSGDFDIMRHGWSADYPDAMTFLTVFAEGHYGHFDNADYKDCINTALTVTGKERDEAMLKAEEILLNEQAALIPLYEVTDPCMIRDTVKDWDKTGYNGWFFGYTDIVKE